MSVTPALERLWQENCGFQTRLSDIIRAFIKQNNMKIKTVESGWPWSSVVQHLLCTYKALGLIHSIKNKHKPE